MPTSAAARAPAVALACALLRAFVVAQDAPTTSYEPPAPLRDRDGAELQVPGHAAVRAADWDLDGDLDLLVGGGDGRLWLLVNGQRRGARGLKLEAAAPIVAGDRARWGKGYTGATLADLDGDGQSDLIVAHSDDRVSFHPRARRSS